MSEEVTKKVRELYDSIMYFPNRVLDIFNDFFGEERVDMQGFPSYYDFLNLLSSHTLSWFFPNKSAVLNCAEFKSISKEEKNIIIALLDNDVLNVSVTSDDAVAMHFLPIMASVISNTMPRGFILVHFPHVRVTNENDRFVDINHLWVKVELNLEGKGAGYFSVNRSEYELSHMKSDYMHSHVPGIPFGDFTKFKSPCLGSGPIRSTVATLAVNYDESIWQLFCLELDKYVKVESISGVPYRYLEKIGSSGDMMSGETTFSMQPIRYAVYDRLLSTENMRNFIRYLIRGKKLKFNFVNGSYGLAMSYLEYRIFISNEFIKWFNRRFNIGAISTTFTELKAGGVLKECIINNGRIEYFRQSTSSNERDYYSYEGALVCTFKGSPVTIHIVNSTLDTDNKTVLVCSSLAEIIAKAVLEVVNYKYGREEERGEAGVNTPAIYL